MDLGWGSIPNATRASGQVSSANPTRATVPAKAIQGAPGRPGLARPGARGPSTVARARLTMVP